MLAFSLKTFPRCQFTILVLRLLGEVVGKAKNNGPLSKPVCYPVFLSIILSEQTTDNSFKMSTYTAAYQYVKNSHRERWLYHDPATEKKQ